MTAPRPLPSSAQIVIIGGGVAGASIAYHLAERGQTDVVLLERAELTSGSTFHSAGLVGQLRADPALTRMNMYSVELYRKLEASDHPVGWQECGGIKLASSAERLAEIRRQISWARTFDLALREISPDEVGRRFPLVDLDGVVGAAVLDSDGYLDPSQLCYSLAQHARAAGVAIHQRTRVVAIDAPDGRVQRVRTDRGDITCAVVVDCAGMVAAEVGRLVGVRVPIVPMSHQYVVTEPFLRAALGDHPPLPTLRDPDLLVYYRQEVDGLVMGGYERTPAPWTADASSFDAVPADFNGKLLAEDWPRFEEIATNAARRVPALADIGMRRMINGPEAFTPDNEFCLGPTDVDGFFVAAGFCAHGIAGAGGVGRIMAEWLLDGEPSMDVSHMDVSRFGPQYRSPAYTLARTLENYRTYYDIPYPDRQRQAGRPLRRSSAYAWHAAHSAVFGEKAGWERVDYYAANAVADESERPAGWAGRGWSSAVGVEHRATRTTAGLFDESSFAKIEISGPDAAAFLEWVCANRVARGVGAVTYTQMLNHRGGIEADVTVTQLAADVFVVVTGTAQGPRDLARLSRLARAFDGTVRVADVTGQTSCFALWGPAARTVLAPLTPSDLGDESFPFMTAQPTTVATVPVRAQRVSFVGEPGWELYAPTEYGATLWETLAAATVAANGRVAGYHAIESLRLEKGYRVWGSDVTAETTPDEAGLRFAVKIDKGEFLGRAVLRAARETGPRRRLRALVLDDARAVVLGSEPVRVAGDVVARVTSGGYGYTLRQSLAYAYLPAGLGPGTRVEIDLFGTWHGGVVATEPLSTAAGT